MIKLNKKDVSKYECIIYRPKRYCKYLPVSPFSVAKTHLEKGYTKLFYFNLEKLVANPTVSDSKDNGQVFKIGILSKDVKLSKITTQSIEVYTRLCVDYDNERKDINLIRKFKKRFKNYSYILYTSFSHSVKCPRFRVIIELKNMLFSEQLNNPMYRKYLVELFSLGKEKPDESCFYPYQCQLLPLTPKPNIYQYHINIGERLELEEYEDICDKFNEKMFKQMNNFRYPDMETVQDDVNSRINCIEEMTVEEEEKFQERLKIVKGPNFNKTAEYKIAKKKLKEPKKDKNFINKFEFNKHYAALVAHGKLSVEDIEKKFKKMYGYEMSSNKVKYKDFIECVAKFKGEK